jgi:hypothetical protein
MNARYDCTRLEDDLKRPVLFARTQPGRIAAFAVLRLNCASQATGHISINETKILENSTSRYLMRGSIL